MSLRLSLSTLFSAVLLSACATQPPAVTTQPRAYAGLEILNATLYQQTAAEYHALSRQVYGQATARLDVALADTSFSAALEQQPPFADKPPAVVVDIDETMLDNAPYEARLVQSGLPFKQSDWGAWVHEAAAPAIPGALEFARACADRGIHVIYMSNRMQSEAEITRVNLARLEFPYATDLSHFQFRPEDKSDPLSSKGGRRSKVAESYRILMLVGDNLGDFTEEFRDSIPKRLAVVKAHVPGTAGPSWGREWFMLPNAMYGSWDDALLDFNRDLDDATRHQRKLKHLDSKGLGPHAH